MTITAIHLAIHLHLDMIILMVLLNNTIDMNGTPLHHQKNFMIMVEMITDRHIEKEAMVPREMVVMGQGPDILMHRIIEMNIEEGAMVLEAVVVVTDIISSTWISEGNIIMKNMERHLITTDATKFQKYLVGITKYRRKEVVTGALCNGVDQLGVKKGKTRKLSKESLGRTIRALITLRKKGPIVVTEHLA